MPVTTKNQLLGALLLAVSAPQISAFQPSPSTVLRSLSLSCNPEPLSDIESSASVDIDLPQSRRALFEKAASVAMVGMAVVTAPVLLKVDVANAASNLPTAADLERLRKGHARIQYLLKNWDEITEVCNNNSDQAIKQVVRTDGGDKCAKTPLNVQIYMGYKSTEDPLYKADKLMVRAAPLIKDDYDQADYLEAVEAYKEKADNTAMMAYTSSWGEANPNGGKDVIDDYLEKTRLDVVASEKSLRLVLKYLGLEPLPASKNP